MEKINLHSFDFRAKNNGQANFTECTHGILTDRFYIAFQFGLFKETHR